MKLRNFLIAVAVIFSVELFCAVLFLTRPLDFTQDIVAVNNVLQSVEKNWANLNPAALPQDLDYCALDVNETVVYRTKSGITDTIDSAVIHRDTILDVVVGGQTMGKVIVYNASFETVAAQRREAVIVMIVALIAQALLCVGYVLYLNRVVISPFSRLHGFAMRIADGALDIPLEMDKRNIFGAFTESFDIMRSELKRARDSEKIANESKKELVAKLSHDIKTPIASIKATAEVGRETAASEKDRKSFKLIESKSDQINALVSNLFSATLEELRQLSVELQDHESAEISDMLKSSDYLGKGTLPQLPPCLLAFDKLRLQQVFDNIVSNSYKYANTEIQISFELLGTGLSVRIEDFGGGVEESELPLLLKKFKRGTNSANKDGAGLGLYISQYLMTAQRGDLAIQNTDKGFAVTVFIPMSGR